MKEDSEPTLSPSDRMAVEYTQKLIKQRGGLSLEYSLDYWRFSTKAELRGPVEADERFLQGIKDAIIKEHKEHEEHEEHGEVEVSVYFLPGPMTWNPKQEAKLIADAKQGDADADQVLRETAAECLERGELPPKPLVDYAATYLRAAASSRKKARQQPNSSKQLHKTKYRDWILALTVDDVARHFNLDRTRNRATERHCGCSIVARATKLSEKTVQNAWHDYERVASQRTATNYVRQAMVSVVTADGAQKHFMVRFPRVGSAEAMSRPSNRKAERAKRNRLRRKHRPR